MVAGNLASPANKPLGCGLDAEWVLLISNRVYVCVNFAPSKPKAASSKAARHSVEIRNQFVANTHPHRRWRSSVARGANQA
jgi:hypothetical protein